MAKRGRIEDIYPLTPMQKGMLFHSLQAPESAVYVVQLTCELEGELDPRAFQVAWQTLMTRHTILRTAFVWKGQREPVQVVARGVEVHWRQEDWRPLPPEGQEERWQTFLADDRRKGFSLNRPPLMRLVTVRLTEERHRFLWSHHHLLMDGWSLPLLMREFFTLYQGERQGRPPALPPVRPFSDFVAWMRRRHDPARAEAFWRRELAGFRSPTVVDLGGPDGEGEGYREEHLRLDEEATAALEQAARRLEVTPGTLVQGAWSLVLARYSGEGEVLFGLVTAVRPPDLPGVEAMVGLLINTLPLRVPVPSAAGVGPWLRRLAERQLAVREHEQTALSDVQGWSELPRDRPLFETLLAFENVPLGEALPPRLDGLAVGEVRMVERTSYPLNLIVIPGERLHLKIGYDSGRHGGAAVCRLLAQLAAALAGLAGEARTLGEISLLPPGEREHLYPPPPAERAPEPPAPSLAAAFRRQAEASPDAVAVVVPEEMDGRVVGESLTYAGLAERAGALARRLVAAGVGPEERVALFLERDADLVAAILAVLEAGGAYLPIDPAAPAERVRYLLDDSRARLLVTDRALAARLGEPGEERSFLLIDSPSPVPSESVDPAGPASHEAGSGQAAYVIYTSGSTGRPKGCVVTHGNALRLFAVTRARFGFDPGEVWTLFHSYAFDFSVWEIWGALLHGGRLVVVPYGVSRDPEAFHRLLARERVTVLSQTPSAFRQLVAADARRPAAELAALRWVAFGGEALEVQSLRPWLQRHGGERPGLVNLYGITETTVHVTYRRVGWQDLRRRGSRVGAPLADLTLYVLDSGGQPAPVGVPGELWVGGAGLSRGYLGRPGLTAGRFLPDPFGGTAGGRLYRTGDLGRWAAPGEDGEARDLEHLGRIDHQVQVRGHRVELGEVESALGRHPAVREAAVVVDGRGDDQRLVAYLAADPGELTAQGLQAFLADWLPDYMVPRRFVRLGALPLTANGKVDRKALPPPAAGRLAAGGLEESTAGGDGQGVALPGAVRSTAPRSADERRLAAIWEEVLGVTGVGVHDNYFALGGDSIRSIAVVTAAREQGIPFTIADLMAHPSIAGLLEHLRQSPAAGEEGSPGPPVLAFDLLSPADREKLPPEVEDAYPLARLQAGMLFHSQFSRQSRAYVDVFSYRLRGPFGVGAFVRAAARLAARHPVLRTGFDFSTYGEALQLVHARAAVPLSLCDLTLLAAPEQEEVVGAWLEAARRRGFDPAEPPLMGLAAHRLDRESFQVSLAVHHAILDGWSFATLMAELLEDYGELLRDRQAPPPPPPPPVFRQFVALERSAVASEESRRFWRGQVGDGEGFTPLPRFREAGARQSPGRRLLHLPVELPEAVSAELTRIAEELGVPVKAVLLAAHLRALAFLTGQPEVTTGLVTSGRPEVAGGERGAGLFLNTLPLRLGLDGGSWRELVRQAAAAEEALAPHRRFPLAEIQRLAASEGVGDKAGGRTLFDTDFNYVHLHVLHRPLRLGGFQVLASRALEETNFLLTANFSQDLEGGRLHATVSCDAGELGEALARRIPRTYGLALAALATDPGAPCLAAPLLTAAERHQLLAEWGQGEAPAGGESFLQTIRRRIAQVPGARAVVDGADGHRCLSYGELGRRAGSLAADLREAGAGTDSLVGVLLGRSAELVVALLAVLEAGAAYLPLDPDFPGARLELILEDSGVGLLLTRSGEPLPAAAARLRRLEVGEGGEPGEGGGPGPAGTAGAPPPRRELPEALAYVLYTSGSTGRPKGAGVSFGALDNHMGWMDRALPLTADDRVFQKTPPGFDASVWEFWAPLMSGAQIVVARPGGHIDPAYLAAVAEEERVSVLQVVPTLLDLLLKEPRFGRGGSLRRLFVGGEPLRTPLLERCRARLGAACTVINLYGVTEAAVDSVVGAVEPEEGAAMAPIGRPIHGVSVHLLDARGRQVPAGTVGELYLGCRGLGRGYLRRPGLTAERFVPHPQSREAGARLYRTGDLARFRPDGTLECLGRADRQVKFRGYRIELEEIEAALARHPAVDQAAALVVEDGGGEPRLVAFVAAGPAGAGAGELRAFLRRRLPDYMVPGAVLFLEELPRNPSGKLDRRALRGLGALEAAPAAASARLYTPPRSEAERVLCEIWRQVLGVERVGAEDNFFELGGDSILSLGIVARAARAGLEITPQLLFEAQTVAEVAARARRRQAGALLHDPEEVGMRVPLTPIQCHFFAQESPNPHHFNQALLVAVPGDFSLPALEAAVARVVAHHGALRLRFEPTGRGWEQRYGAAEGAAVVEGVDLSRLAPEDRPGALAESARRTQGGLHLSRGPLLRALWLSYGPAEPGRLLLVAHHLVVDGVSWRVLAEDLARAYEAARRGQEAELAPVPVSYRRWASSLQELAASPELEAEAAFWLAPKGTGEESPLPLDFPGGRAANTEADARVVTATLEPEVTDALLRQAPQAYHARAEDLLLAALARTLAEWSGRERVRVDLEGHGREALGREDGGPGLDLSRTVGWFTALYPVALAWQPEQGPGEALCAVKEELRRVPRKGLGYGLLRHLSPDPELRRRLAGLPRAEVSFNHLGRFDAPGGLFQRAVEEVGPDRAPEAPRPYLLDVVSLVAGGRLEVQWIYGEKAHRRETVEALAGAFLGHLRELVAHCLQPGAGGYTPSDFPLAGLDPAGLEQVVGQLGGEAARQLVDLYPLSPLGEGLLFHALDREAAGLYLQQVTAAVAGELEPRALEAAWRRVFERHEVFRSAFVWGELRRPLQAVMARVEVPIAWVDLSALAPADREEAWRRALAADRRRGLDPRRPPLVRLAAVRLEPGAWRLLWSHHHLLLDGWSLPLVFREVLTFYRQARAGVREEPPRPPRYRDFIAWREARDPAAEEAFWRQALAGLTEATVLPRFPVTEAAAAPYARQALDLPAELSARLEAFARSHHLTLNSLFQGMWALLLSRYCGSGDLLYGVTVAGRPPELPASDAMVGLFINTLPLRVRVEPGATVTGFLRQVQERQLAVSRHGASRLVDVHGWSDVPRGQLLFESIVVFENYPLDRSLGEESDGGLAVAGVEVEEQTHLPLTLYVFPGREIRLQAAYQTERFPGAVVRGMLERGTRLLAGMLRSPQGPVAALELTSPEERRRLAEELNRTEVDRGREVTVVAAVRRQGRERPDALAVTGGDESLTYGELLRRAGRLAARLQGARGAQGAQGALVGIFLDRTPEMLTAILGILQAGAAYLPLDPAFPRRRLALMLEDSAAPLVVTTPDLAPELPATGARLVFLGAGGEGEGGLEPAAAAGGPASGPSPGDLAYVIFTSGSTGRPKGVEIEHGALANLLDAFAHRPGLTAADSLLAVTTLSFDIAGLELLGPLVTGGRVVLADRETARQGEELARLLARERCTLMQATPATWRLLLAAGWRPPPELTAWCGGEALPPDLARELLAGGGEPWNVYGPTETTIWSLVQPVREPGDAAFIGRPVANTRIFILDREGYLQPEGIPGELWIGGAGVARGYLRRPGLTAERFRPDPFSRRPGQRLYRTGDGARWRPEAGAEDGRVEFLGRLDSQVKIRGFRVELGEIEAALQEDRAVSQAAVVLDRAGGQSRLVAYLVAREGAEAAEELAAGLRRRLAEGLPDYMLPSLFVPLPALPLTPNGKLDRRALPSPGGAALAGRSHVPPRSALEEILISVWGEVLGLEGVGGEGVGAEDDFFELGGHSLLATQVQAKLQRIFQVELPVGRLFAATTVARLAALLTGLEPQPGRMEKIARLLLDVRKMTPEEREALRRRRAQTRVRASPGPSSDSPPSGPPSGRADRTDGPLSDTRSDARNDAMSERRAP